MAAPGCVQYGPRVFAERCSLGRVGASRETEDSNVLAPGAQLGKYAFESCLTLATITFDMDHTAENLNPKRSKFSYREKPTKKQENHKAKVTNYHGGLSSFRKHRPHPTLSSTPFSRRQVSVTLAQASSVPRLLVSILQTLVFEPQFA